MACAKKEAVFLMERIWAKAHSGERLALVRRQGERRPSAVRGEVVGEHDAEGEDAVVVEQGQAMRSRIRHRADEIPVPRRVRPTLPRRRSTSSTYSVCATVANSSRYLRTIAPVL